MTHTTEPQRIEKKPSELIKQIAQNNCLQRGGEPWDNEDNAMDWINAIIEYLDEKEL